MSQPLLSVNGLQVRYGPVQAVRGIDLTVHQGEIVALMGANGAGKSSTLNALVGLVPKAAGQVLFDGHDITGALPETLAARGLTLSPEGRRVFGALSVEDNLRMGAFGLRDPGEIARNRDRIHDLFPILAERRQQFAGTLSGGQQQMLAVGRALMCNPKLLLLDEPSLGLAPKIVEQVFDLITTLRDQGITIVVVEQNVGMALEIADRGYVFASGQVELSGASADLQNDDAMQSAYLGGS